MLVMVKHGTPIRTAAKAVFVFPVMYYRIATELEKRTVLRARREYTTKGQTGCSDRLVTKRIIMPASRRNKLQRLCDGKNQTVNGFVNGLILRELERLSDSGESTE